MHKLDLRKSLRAGQDWKVTMTLHSIALHCTMLYYYTSQRILALWDFIMLFTPYVQKDQATPQRIVPLLLFGFNGSSASWQLTFSFSSSIMASVHLVSSALWPSSFSYSLAYGVIQKNDVSRHVIKARDRKINKEWKWDKGGNCALNGHILEFVDLQTVRHFGWQWLSLQQATSSLLSSTFLFTFSYRFHIHVRTPFIWSFESKLPYWLWTY